MGSSSMLPSFPEKVMEQEEKVLILFESTIVVLGSHLKTSIREIKTGVFISILLMMLRKWR